MVGGHDVPTFTRLDIKAVISDKLAVNITCRGSLCKPSIQIFSTYVINRGNAKLIFFLLNKNPFFSVSFRRGF